MTNAQMWWQMDELKRKRLRLESDRDRVKPWLNRAQDEPTKKRLRRERRYRNQARQSAARIIAIEIRRPRRDNRQRRCCPPSGSQPSQETDSARRRRNPTLFATPVARAFS